MRGLKPFIFSNLKTEEGLNYISNFIVDYAGLSSSTKSGVE